MEAVGYVRRSVRSDERTGLPPTIPKMKRLATSGIRNMTLLIAQPLRYRSVQEGGRIFRRPFPLGKMTLNLGGPLLPGSSKRGGVP